VRASGRQHFRSSERAWTLLAIVGALSSNPLPGFAASDGSVILSRGKGELNAAV
jgi:hypothetical protein